MSCSKEELLPTTSGSNEAGETINSLLGKTSGARTYLDNGEVPGVEGEDYGCFNGGGGCLPTIVITAAMAPTVNAIGDAGDAGNNTEVVNLVRNNKAALLNIVSLSLLDDVINGSLTLRVRGRITSNSGAYLVFSTGSSVKSVTPVKL